jgi:hypothetical protein
VFARGNRRRQVARPARGPALRAHRPWYVARALRAEVARLARRRGALLGGAALLLAGCGALPAQDENEPEGKFPVDVVRADFPEQQKLAKDSQLVIEVKNEGKKEIPDVNVTVHGFSRKLKDPTDPDKIDPTVANPSRPVFVVDKSPIEFLRDPGKGEQSLVDREVNPPYGRETAYVNTYSLGELAPKDTALFRWNVSAVEAGPYKLEYTVNVGLDGVAEAVSEGGEPLEGEIRGVISDRSPPARVLSSDGETIVTRDGRRIENQRGVIRDE